MGDAVLYLFLGRAGFLCGSVFFFSLGSLFLRNCPLRLLLNRFGSCFSLFRSGFPLRYRRLFLLEKFRRLASANRDGVRIHFWRGGEHPLAPIALRTFGHAFDVAWGMAFLAADYARYITGTCLEISGGKMGVQNPAKAWQDKETRG